MKKFKSNLLMLLTFIALPYYMIRCKILLKKQDPDLIRKELSRYGNDFLGIRNITLEIQGEAHYRDLDSCVFVCNHQSHNDIFILLAALKKQFRFIAKKELFTNFIFKKFMKLSESYPLDRKDDKASLLVLKQAVKDISETQASVVVFPEGTRSHSPELGEFKVGLFSMLRRAKTPIVPIYIENSYEVGAKTFKVHIGAAIEPDGLSGAALCDKSREAIIALQQRSQRT